MDAIDLYQSLDLQKFQIEDVTIGYRRIGIGEDLVFIHGFPTHGYTWRKLLPSLSQKFKCHIVDLPGLGDSDWSEQADFKSKAQARYIIRLLEKLSIESYSLIAHNSGATVARSIAINESQSVKQLILLNTEIPNHRPPWIPFYQKVGLLPLVPSIITTLLKQKWFIKSSMGFKEFYADKSMLDDGVNVQAYIDPVIQSSRKTIGAFKYLKGIDWKLIDDFKQSHGKIKARTLFLWGDQDKTFPIELGRQMLDQFKCEVKFVTIKDSSLLPHEEKPNEVCQAILDFTNKESN